MYSDIIPPKKKYTHLRTEEYNTVRFSAPHQSYSKQQKRKAPVVLLLAAITVLALGGYHILAHRTVLHITPKTTRFEIKQNIPLVLQGREHKSLTYSLVYVPASTEEGVVRNPFVTQASASSSTVSTSPKKEVGLITIRASTTGDVKQITVINRTGSPVSLKKDTRFDVDGVTYLLDEAAQFSPTEKNVLLALATSTKVYKVIGFKGFATYDSVYAVPQISKISEVESTARTSSSTEPVGSSTVPPKELLSLMPPKTLALQKSTIYDKIVDQSAVVVFDQRTLEEFLQTHIQQTEEYYKVMKSFGESASYTVVIVDYTLNRSEETGKPISISSLVLEITPDIQADPLKLQFAGFSKDSMSIIEKQVQPYITLKTSYTPFWSSTVAEYTKIQVELLSQNQ